MKTRYMVVFFLLMLSPLIFVSIGLAQSAQCVVNQVQGGLVTATCPGDGTRVENIGGTADRYKVGDTIMLPSQTQSKGNVGSRPISEPKSGRR